MKKRIALLLAIIIILGTPLSVIGVSDASATNTPFYDGDRYFVKDPYNSLSWTDYKAQNFVPFELKMKNVDGFYFNMEIWEDKKVAVYGSHPDVPANTFKNSTQKRDANEQVIITENKGYYEGGTGEYRYHGFDANGNVYANNSFPVDVISTRKASDKKWIYQYWEPTNPYYLNWHGVPYVNEMSDYNKMAIKPRAGTNQTLITQTRNWINESLPFELDRSNNDSDKNAYNYIHVQSRPTSLFPGDGKMVHITTKSNGIITPWYQTFTLSKIEDKASTPVEARIEITSISDKAVDDSGAVVLKGIIHGKLQDDYMFDSIDAEGIPDDVYRGAFYNRCLSTKLSVKPKN